MNAFSSVAWALVIGCGIAVAALQLAEARQLWWLKAASKPLASSAFVALAVVLGALNTPFGQGILLALLLCWIGDVCLLWRQNLPFRLGLASFLLGHLVFAWIFASLPWRWSGLLAASLPVAALVVVALLWLRPHLRSLYRIAVPAYIGALGLMLLSAIAASLGGASALLASGAVLFAISDLAVARDRFVQPAFLNKLWGQPTYYLAQVLLASSVA